MVVNKWHEVNPALSPPVLSAIKKLAFDKMTPIQAAVIPLLTSCKDVVAEAVTGSGKTLAFVVPLLELLLRRAKDSEWRKDEVGAVIISPTRELASQTNEVVDIFLNEPELSHFKKLLLVGGTSPEEDVRTLRQEGANIIICTPGRFEDLLTRKFDFNLSAKLKQLELLVLDEADRLLDLGFSSSLTTILGYLPRQRRTGLFSATQTKQLDDLVRAGLRNPVVVSVKEKSSISTPIMLENFYKLVEPENKLLLLVNFLKSRTINKAIFFLPTCACVDYWGDVLPHLLPSLKIFALHGKMKHKRGQILEKFRKAEATILLCTDLLARGLDIPEVEWVFQWEPPTNPAALVHRVGRTARGGTAGCSLLPLLPSEETYVHFIKSNQKVDLMELDMKREKIKVTDEGRGKILKTIHNLQLKDRAIFDKASRAFVSHIQSYSKHECNLLLRLKELPLGHIATSYGLLKLPLMPEINDAHKQQFEGPKLDIDMNAIAYKDKQKEASRLLKLQTFKATGVWPSKNKKKKGKVQSEPWQQTKLQKQEKKDKKRKRKADKKNADAPIKGVKRKKGVSQEDLDELSKDIELFKKLKKGKITDAEFDKEIGLDID